MKDANSGRCKLWRLGSLVGLKVPPMYLTRNNQGLGELNAVLAFLTDIVKANIFFCLELTPCLIMCL